MEINKYAIFGSAGMLGDAFIEQLPDNSLFTDKNVNRLNIKFCDITDYVSVNKIIDEYNPDIIINLAAITDLEHAQCNKVECYNTNTLAAINLFEIAKKLNIPYVFISTAGIYGDQKDVYDDYDTPTPLSDYGISKYLTETYMQQSSYSKFYIFRAGWMMGGGKFLDKKFVNKIFKQLENKRTEINAVDDKLGVPTYTKDFASSIIKHIKNDLPYGLYNQIGNGEASRYDVAVEMVKYLGVDVIVNKVGSDFFGNEYFVERPYSEILVNKKLNELNANYMRDWKVCLHEYLDEHYQ